MIIIVFVSLEARSEDLRSLIKQKKYKEVVSYFDTKQAPKNYKENAYLILAYKKLGKLNKLISALEASVKAYPDKEVLIRELSSAYEQKSHFVSDKKSTKKSKEKNEDHSKRKHYLKALNLLNDLRDKNPSPENLTSFIKFLIRNKDYNQAEGVLEFYSRTYTKGDTYYSFLCEVQFKKKFYGEAMNSCGMVKDNDAVFLKHVQAKEMFEQSEMESKNLIAAGSRFPASTSIHLEIGKRLFSEDKFKQSINYFTKANQKNPTAEAYRLIAESEFSLQNYSASLDSFKKACEIETGSKAHIYSKIRLFSKKVPKGNPIHEPFKLEIARCKHIR